MYALLENVWLIVGNLDMDYEKYCLMTILKHNLSNS